MIFITNPEIYDLFFFFFKGLSDINARQILVDNTPYTQIHVSFMIHNGFSKRKRIVLSEFLSLNNPSYDTIRITDKKNDKVTGHSS